MATHSPHATDRNTLFIELEQFLSVHKASSKKFALLLINIDHFRQINIVYGHQAGDLLLNEFSRRLAALSRQQDYIARMGNSEFIMILPEILNEGHATLAAHKLLGSLLEPFNLGISRHKVTAHIGIALYPEHGSSISELLKNAEIALLEARTGIQSFAIYSSGSHQVDINTWDIEIELQNAQDQDEFELFFQPQIWLQTGHVFGAEALIRWKNKDRGYIRPDIFIPVAERSGQIHGITWWTINAALRLIKAWPDLEKPLNVAVNISAKVLRDHDLADSIRSALKIWGTDPARLILEVTESALMEDMTTSFNTLDELRALGLNISIDDFGTGYSSMAYFKNIPASELKIDQSFVSYMLENSMDQHIVKTIIKMAHGFDLKVVAEGVENRETLEALKELGCDVAQGYYLARPMPQDEFIQWLNNCKRV
jgi:diguanylate cyclase (GGDEF)-like protein